MIPDSILGEIKQSKTLALFMFDLVCCCLALCFPYDGKKDDIDHYNVLAGLSFINQVVILAARHCTALLGHQLLPRAHSPYNCL